MFSSYVGSFIFICIASKVSYVVTYEACQTAGGRYNSVGGSIFPNKDQCGFIAGHNNYLTSWTISGPFSTYITLVVLKMQMSSYYCSENYVEVLENRTILLDKTCNTDYVTNYVTSDFTPRYMASSLSNSLSVNYLGTANTDMGFEAVYYARGRHSVLTDDFGYIASPGYPVSYPNNANYTWLITSNTGNRINLNISFNLEATYDKVNVYDGQYLSSVLLDSLSDTSSRNIRSTSNSMLIQFTSDGSNAYSGFRASYSTNAYFNEASYGQRCTSSIRCIYGLACYGGVCGCNQTQYYSESTRSCSTPSYGQRCTSSNRCIYGLTCYGGVCGCNQTQYYSESSRSCSTRKSHGSNCNSEEICNQEFVCVNSKCSCQKHQYYDISSDHCKSGRLKGDSCSSDDKCSDDLECVLYTCQETTNQYDIYADYDRPNVIAVAMVIVAVIGWAVVLTLSIALGVMCVKYRKQRLSQTNNINGEIQHQAPLPNNSQGYLQTPNEQSFQIPNQQYLQPTNQFVSPNFQAVSPNQYIPMQQVFSGQPDLQQQTTQQPNLQQNVAHQHDMQQQIGHQNGLHQQPPNHPGPSNATQAKDNEGFEQDSPSAPEDDDVYLNVNYVTDK